MARFVYQDNPDLQKARAAFLRQEYPLSLRLFEKCAKRQPNNLMALTDAARAFGQRFEIARALDCIRRMRQLAEGDARAMFLAGQSLRMAYRSDDAVELLRQTVRIGTPPAEAHLELAVLLERRHLLDEAMESVGRYLGEAPNNPEGTLLMARILRRRGEMPQACAVYEELATRNGSIPATRARALNEWANLLDSLQDYDAAFSKLLESKALLAAMSETGAVSRRMIQEQSRLDHLTESTTPDHLSRWCDGEAIQDQQTVLLTGCPRSGTTLIEKILDAHPGVLTADEFAVYPNLILPRLLHCMRVGSERFDADFLDRLPADTLRREALEYIRNLEEVMGEPIGARILVDKNPSMTFLLASTFRLLPRNRVLFALRDPRDIAVSCFFRWLPINSVSVSFLSFEGACMRTAAELECWLRIRPMLPEGRYLETRYEDTVADYSGEARRILDWMGLTWDDSIADYRDHMRRRSVNSPTYEAVDKPIHRSALARWKNYEGKIAEHLPIMCPVIDKLGY
jgi:uncharacterized protein HemY